MHRHFSEGDLLFRQGDPSDYVLRVDSGSVEILREVGDVTIVLGSVFAGQFVGEMGVIEKRPAFRDREVGSKSGMIHGIGNPRDSAIVAHRTHSYNSKTQPVMNPESPPCSRNRLALPMI